MNASCLGVRCESSEEGSISYFGIRGRMTHTHFLDGWIHAYMIDQLMAHDVSGCPLGAAVPAPAPPRVSPPSGLQRASDPCFYEVAGMYRHD